MNGASQEKLKQHLKLAEKQKKRPDRNPASCKIQYPMKNRDKDADLNGITKLLFNYYFLTNIVKMKKLCKVYTTLL